ncbi:hypothetical protein M2175_004923 [Bradyrhizobium elkanii]|uniref:hypothetical protein n=1 Tax=Bradyrhizobium TaxID=374 RepID=UPI002168CF79|nr:MULTISPECIES: hypothetical protein [Bradyrhizobium]MCS3929892.1 hypothetical protein [Bradyrhizobium elkanii]MCS3970449.1 hypothetical protein [Bradyrhizobium japonicum]
MNITPTMRALVWSTSVLALTIGPTFAQQISGTPADVLLALTAGVRASNAVPQATKMVGVQVRNALGASCR